jgi:hypothetical protein
MSEHTLSDDKWVRVMADYGSCGLWAKDGCGVGDDELPVSDEIKERLRKWQHWFDDEHPDFDVEKFSDEGRDIAHIIKAALPDWTVIYFDEARSGNVPRLDFEYEIWPA